MSPSTEQSSCCCCFYCSSLKQKIARNPPTFRHNVSTIGNSRQDECVKKTVNHKKISSTSVKQASTVSSEVVHDEQKDDSGGDGFHDQLTMDRENAKKFVQEVRLEPVLLYSSLTTDCTEKVAFTTENREEIDITPKLDAEGSSEGTEVEGEGNTNGHGQLMKIQDVFSYCFTNFSGKLVNFLNIAYAWCTSTLLDILEYFNCEASGYQAKLLNSTENLNIDLIPIASSSSFSIHSFLENLY
ncbi:unnamed protein product [Enterobius vermicularis]|uniref:Uncharacterized protein n=1 Tax=Enterobius vermicularis TaxID=51028 RepID=A0A0N4V764_ENTVE|nr:unnamed protein product [Enterobius vermicularis]